MTPEETLQALLNEHGNGGTDYLEIYAKGGQAAVAVVDEEGDEVAAFDDHDLTDEQRQAVITIYDRDYPTNPMTLINPSAKAMSWPESGATALLREIAAERGQS